MSTNAKERTGAENPENDKQDEGMASNRQSDPMELEPTRTEQDDLEGSRKLSPEEELRASVSPSLLFVSSMGDPEIQILVGQYSNDEFINLILDNPNHYRNFEVENTLYPEYETGKSQNKRDCDIARTLNTIANRARCVRRLKLLI